ncbi:MAG: adenosine deaminase [Candidatus Parcubacteria bacterium]|nr:MAG: adenosine deaminase [Candidatus Parcubacteria bacterium]
MSKKAQSQKEYAELHSHLGGATPVADLWEIAHLEGIRLPTKEYNEFANLVSARGRRIRGVAALTEGPYYWTELIQSSPLSIERAVYRTLCGAYRASRVVVHELRFNPAKRNRGGERDLDHIITAALRGMERAQLEFPRLRAGLIFSLDRTFSRKLNEIIYEKALRYRSRGVVGIDLAGPQNPSFRIEEYGDLFQEAQQRELGVTIHTGEEGNLDEMRFVVERIVPQRIGHGVLAARSARLTAMLAERGITLELCPTSNLTLGVFRPARALCAALGKLMRAGVRLTINTDGPAMYQTSVPQEFTLLARACGWDPQALERARKAAFAASFLKEATMVNA